MSLFKKVVPFRFRSPEEQDEIIKQTRAKRMKAEEKRGRIDTLSKERARIRKADPPIRDTLIEGAGRTARGIKKGLDFIGGMQGTVTGRGSKGGDFDLIGGDLLFGSSPSRSKKRKKKSKKRKAKGSKGRQITINF